MENKKSKATWVLVFALLLIVTGLGGAAYALMKNSDDTASEQQTAEEMGMTDEEHANMDKATETTTKSEAVITFTDDGFDKSTYTFPAGKTVTVKNNSSMDVQFSSDDHPSHRDNPELNMEVLAAGESGTFTPPGKGTYGFHDHINDQFTGTIVVE